MKCYFLYILMYVTGSFGQEGPVRVCDRTESTAMIKFKKHPDCLDSTQYGKDRRRIGTLMVFKTKPKFNVTTVKGFACWWFVHYRKHYFDSWDQPVPASEDQCRFWALHKKGQTSIYFWL